MDLPVDDDRISFHADNFYDANEVARMEGNVQLETLDKSIRVNADNILINKEERKLYVYSDDFVPSIYPVDKDKCKKASGYGIRVHPITKEEKMHNGIDFSADTGTPIRSTANGTVRSTEMHKSYGNRVIVDHGNGYSTSYSQMQKYNVETGQSVKKGDVIGYVGSTGMSTGPHLHYEIMKDGKYVDPAEYLGTITE